jgi:1,2-dihydroxy-3-keto-5-methylthiopentene dioxygenase
MTRLVIAADAKPDLVITDTNNALEIAEQLRAIGCRFEQWTASASLADDADQAAVLAAYNSDVTRLNELEGFTTVDVVRMRRTSETDAEWAEKVTGGRNKFLAEHTHDDDEVRFFVEGSGAFYLRANNKVHIVVCQAGDLLGFPAGMTHWFDMGTNPGFCAIRFFHDPNGWVGNFTGDDIATRFSTYDELVGVAKALR